jgi:hypothetical protein
VDHNIRFSDQSIDDCGITDVALNQPEAVPGKAGQRLRVAGVGELIKDCDVVVRVLQYVVDKVRTDETGAAGDEEFLHPYRLSGHPAIGPPGTSLSAVHSGAACADPVT